MDRETRLTDRETRLTDRKTRRTVRRWLATTSEPLRRDDRKRAGGQQATAPIPRAHDKLRALAISGFSESSHNLH